MCAAGHLESLSSRTRCSITVRIVSVSMSFVLQRVLGIEVAHSYTDDPRNSSAIGLQRTTHVRGQLLTVNE